MGVVGGSRPGVKSQKGPHRVVDDVEPKRERGIERSFRPTGRHGTQRVFGQADVGVWTVRSDADRDGDSRRADEGERKEGKRLWKVAADWVSKPGRMSGVNGSLS